VCYCYNYNYSAARVSAEKKLWDFGRAYSAHHRVSYRTINFEIGCSSCRLAIRNATIIVVIPTVCTAQRRFSEIEYGIVLLSYCLIRALIVLCANYTDALIRTIITRYNVVSGRVRDAAVMYIKL